VVSRDDEAHREPAAKEADHGADSSHAFVMREEKANPAKKEARGNAPEEKAEAEEQDHAKNVMRAR